MVLREELTIGGGGGRLAGPLLDILVPVTFLLGGGGAALLMATYFWAHALSSFDPGGEWILDNGGWGVFPLSREHLFFHSFSRRA